MSYAWIPPAQGQQIYLLGNPVVWWSGAVALVIYIGLEIFYALRERRAIYDITANALAE